MIEFVRGWPSRSGRCREGISSNRWCASALLEQCPRNCGRDQEFADGVRGTFRRAPGVHRRCSGTLDRDQPLLDGVRGGLGSGRGVIGMFEVSREPGTVATGLPGLGSRFGLDLGWIRFILFLIVF